jgi:hypothetical protein
MAQQLELLPQATLDLRPKDGHSEPRLWVRRFVVWRSPGVIVRQETLRPGLNIVWSPDPSDLVATDGETSALGHGSGKTLFCRLIRYCLGEERFAQDAQRESISAAFTAGMVGAEVMLDGRQWAIVRSIGNERRDIAIPDGDLDALAVADVEATGMRPFLDAVEADILSSEVAALMPGDRPRRAWLIALAWLSRDQECRFDHVLDWRSSASDSASPARGLSRTQSLDALRTLLGTIGHEERALRVSIERHERVGSETRELGAHRAWEVQERTNRVCRALSLDPATLLPGPLGVDSLRQAASAAFARVALVLPTADVANIGSLRIARDDARAHETTLRDGVAQLRGQIPELERLVAAIRGEMPALSFATHEALNQVCPICEVSIDRALAEGCRLSHKLLDPVETRQRWNERVSTLADAQRRLEESQTQRSRLEAELRRASRDLADRQGRLDQAERANDLRSAEWYRTRRLMDDVEDLARLADEQRESEAAAAHLKDTVQTDRDRVATHRGRGGRAFERVAHFFDFFVRRLVTPKARGRIAFDKSGLRLAIELGGERSTSAIESLKVVAFDLAAMCVSMEGETHLPAFLIHDSPREADLGLSAYHRLFDLVRGLEDVSERPLFQYIITTTTRPPAALARMPWLGVTLQGTLVEERLLRCDL